MGSIRKHGVSAGLLIAVSTAVLALQSGCGGAPAKPKAASPAAPAAPSTGPPVGSPAAAENPRHRVDETAADRERIIQPWRTCMKDHGADLDSQPPNVAGAEQWTREHQDAADACGRLLPLLPWGEDPSNPQYRDNIHELVQCMNDQGLNIVETPDDLDMPWKYRDQSTVPPGKRDQIEGDCEKATIGKSDK